MWPHFVHLVWRIIHGMPLLVSSNWANWGLAFASFVFVEFLLLLTDRFDRKIWWSKRRKNALVAIASAVFAYALLFAWSTVQTVYDDHHDAVGRWQALVKEKNDLKEQLGQRDSYIADLQSGKYLKPQRALRTEIETEGQASVGGMPWLVITATIWNVGPPTIVHNYQLSIIISDRKVSGRPEYIANDIVWRGSRYHKEDALYNKTTTPIPTGGEAAGLLAFSFPDVSTQDILKPGLRLHLTFMDVNNTTYTKDVTVSLNNWGDTWYIPGMLPPR